MTAPFAARLSRLIPLRDYALKRLRLGLRPEVSLAVKSPASSLRPVRPRNMESIAITAADPNTGRANAVRKFPSRTDRRAGKVPLREGRSCRMRTVPDTRAVICNAASCAGVRSVEPPAHDSPPSPR